MSVTDNDIRELKDGLSPTSLLYTYCQVALGIKKMRSIPREDARAKCEEVLRARITCKACEGDGILMADRNTPENERVTRDSRRCNYCRGKGYIEKASK